MWFTTVFLASFICTALTAPAEEVTFTVSSDGNTTSLSSVNTHEEPCIRRGGMCILREHCPAGNLSEEEGLCPEQQKSGVECCHGLSREERRCSARGGICRPKHKCGRQLWEEDSTDCPSGHTCCILVS